MAKIDKIKVGNTTYDVGGGDNYTTCQLGAFAAAGSKDVTGITGLTANSTPILDVVTSTTAATAETELEDWSKIYHADTTANGTIRFYANDATSQTLTISVKGF